MLESENSALVLGQDLDLVEVRVPLEPAGECGVEEHGLGEAMRLMGDDGAVVVLFQASASLVYIEWIERFDLYLEAGGFLVLLVSLAEAKGHGLELLSKRIELSDSEYLSLWDFR